jgi:hypothetical protein
VVKEKRKPVVFLGLPLWAWIVVLVIFLAPMLGQCFMMPPVPGG